MAADTRAELLKLAAVLGTRDGALRRDECGDWRLKGQTGHIYSVPEGYQAFFLSDGKGWHWAKVALPAFRVRIRDNIDDQLLKHKVEVIENILRETVLLPEFGKGRHHLRKTGKIIFKRQCHGFVVPKVLPAIPQHQ